VYRSTTNPTFERTTNGDAPLSPFVVRSTFTSGRLPMLNGSYFSAVLLGGAIGGALDILFAISFAAYKIRSRPSAANRRKWLTGCIRIRGRRSRSGVGPCPTLWPVFLVGNCFLGVGVAGAISDPLPVCSRCVGFGVAVFLVMRLVVLPLSAFPYPVTFEPLATTLDLLSHALLFGFPIALALRKGLIGVSSAA